MFHSKTWDSVPPGSTLSVVITHSGPFALVGVHTVDRGERNPVLSGNFGAGNFPLAFRIATGESHVVDFEVAFVGKPCTFGVDARIVTPQGTNHQGTLSFQENLSADSPLTVKLFA